MLKKAALVAVACVIVVAGLYRFGGRRLSRDGSGIWPRFFSSEPNYDALEVDRARQRERRLPSSSGSDALPQPPVTSAAVAEQPHAAPVTSPIGVTAASSSAHPRGYWPAFRGPSRDGRYDEQIRTNWPGEGLPRLWKQPIGLGYASFVVADGRAFTIEQRRQQELVSAYDVQTGRELWTHGRDGEFIEVTGGDGPRATPTYHDARIYALGALGELRCLDARTGTLIWRRNILTDNGASNLEWGMAAAPLIVDDKVVVLPGGRDGKSVAAYDRMTGEPRWTALDDQQAYTSPMLVTLGGVRQILTSALLARPESRSTAGVCCGSIRG